MARFPDPPHAHIPGQTPRHPAGTFEALCETVRPEQPSGAVFASDAWRAGLQFFDTGYYWEAHEVWEAVWMALPDGSDEKRLVQGMIQLANACLKRRMQRPRAVQRLCEICGRQLDGLPSSLWITSGLREEQIRNQLSKLGQSGTAHPNYAL
jgi:hypothetical protein